MAQNTYTQDFYTKKAKNEGWAARSVYKLQEIDKHFLKLKNITRPLHILDLGASPGSWTQYLQKNISQESSILSLDISPISATFLPRPHVKHIVADLTDSETIDLLIQRGPFDYIVSDAAPSTTGKKSMDSARSELIVETVSVIAQHSMPHGIAVAKLFQGAGTSELLKQLQKTFSDVRCFTPKAVRTHSFETYLIMRS